MQSDKDTSDIKSRGLTVVTELGTPVDIMAVLQMSWHQRFRVRTLIGRNREVSGKSVELGTGRFKIILKK